MFLLYIFIYIDIYKVNYNDIFGYYILLAGIVIVLDT
jgi:hypothetical protein